MAKRVTKTLLLTGFVGLILGLCLLPSSRGQNQRDAFSRWRPTHELAGGHYVGSSACAQCHALLTAKRLANPMSRALAPIESCEILKAHPRLNFRNGPYNYEIVREGNHSIYTITDGLNSIPNQSSTALAKAKLVRLMCFNIRECSTKAASVTIRKSKLSTSQSCNRVRCLNRSQLVLG